MRENLRIDQELYAMLCGDLNGKEVQKGRGYMYVWLIQFAVLQKQTHYKATILQ